MDLYAEPHSDIGSASRPGSDAADPRAWRAAQGDHAALLARAAQALGQLDGALAAQPEARAGLVRRLAILEAGAMLWAQGQPVGSDDLARDLMEARAGTDLDGLQAGRWALRRLQGQGALADLPGFLGLHRRQDDGADGPLAPRPTGAAFDAAAQDFRQALSALEDLHPIARAAAALPLWRLAGLSRDGDVIEAATWAARAMADGCEGLPFAPIGAGGRRIWTQGGTPSGRLAGWCRAVAAGAAEARTSLLRLTAWRAGAARQTARIKGDNAARILDALAAEPVMSTAMVETAAAISRDTAERLLARLAGLGLVREITGARRFRLWAAAPERLGDRPHSQHSHDSRLIMPSGHPGNYTSLTDVTQGPADRTTDR